MSVSTVMLLAAAFVQTGTAPLDRDTAFRLMRESAERYQVTLTGEGKETAASLDEEPLLRWSNPERGGPVGGVFLWTDRGRPVAALCVFPNLAALDHEWQSLSEAPLRASYPGAAEWAPSAAGLKFAPVADAPPVAESAVLRLSQMRSLARRYTASIYKPPRSQRVRLLTQPIYRYPEATPGAEDGAIFAFAQGTDPEVLLLLEARRHADGLRWEYAFARMSSVFLECRERDRVVWGVEPDWSGDPTQPYVTFLKRVELPAPVAREGEEPEK